MRSFLIFTLIISITIATPLFSTEDPLDLSDMSFTLTEDDRPNVEIISSVKPSPGKFHSMTGDFLPVWARMLMLIIIDYKTTCNQASSCSSTLNEAIRTISKLGFSSGRDFCRKHEATVICSCLSFTPNCYPASSCQLGLNEIMKILPNIPLNSIWGECTGDSLVKWNGFFAVCFMVSIVYFPHILRWILMRNNRRLYMILHSARDSLICWHFAKSSRKQKTTRRAWTTVAITRFVCIFVLA